jgi:REP element-mobilizing transposase RayT
MPIYKRTYSPGQLQFITTSTYRRAPLFLSRHFCRCFVQTLAEAREEMKFRLLGWVLMPDHFHLLLQPQSAESTPPDPEGTEGANGRPYSQDAS